MTNVCQVSLDNDFIVPNGNIIIPWSSAKFNDPSTMWDIAHPSRIVAPVTGLYSLSVILGWDALESLGVTNCSFIKNNSTGIQYAIWQYSFPKNYQYWFLNGNIEILLNENEYIEILAGQSSGRNVGLRSEYRSYTRATLKLIS